MNKIEDRFIGDPNIPAKVEKNQKIIVWMDGNIKTEWNQRAVNYIKAQIEPTPVVCEAATIEEGIRYLSKDQFEFRLIYVIVSGSLSQIYMDNYENIIFPLKIVTSNIIFCGNKSYHQGKVFVDDKFFNPGGIHDNFPEVVEYIKKDEKNFDEIIVKKENKNSSNKSAGFGCSFETIQCLEKLAYPAMLGQVIKENSIKLGHFNNFIKYVCNYGNPKLTRLVNPSEHKEIDLPYYLYSKFFTRLYSIQSDFYVDVNKALRKKDYELFRPFIYTLYFGLKEGYLKSYKDSRIYRGQFITETEFQGLIKCFNEANNNRFKTGEDSEKYIIGNTEVSLATFTANTFLSFSKDEKIVDDIFIKQLFKIFDKEGEGKRIVKIIIEPIEDQKSNYFVSNIDIEKFSAIKKEKEVLVLPFSCFEVENIEENPKVSKIYLKHLNKYEKQIKDYIKWQSEAEVAKFLNKAEKANQESSFFNKSEDPGKDSKKLSNYFNSRMVVWIDQYANCQRYASWIEYYWQYLQGYYFVRANTVEKGYNILKNCENRLTYVIVSGKFSAQFMEQYREKVKLHKLVTANIILCENKELYGAYSQQKFIKDPFLNPGGIVQSFEDVIRYLRYDQTQFGQLSGGEKEEVSRFEDEKKYGRTFIYLEGQCGGITAQAFGMYYKDSTLIQRHLLAFAKIIHQKYKNPELSTLAYPTLEKIIDIPICIYSISYLKMYMDRGNFFSDMCKDLTNGQYNNYRPYIYIMYSGIKDGYLKTYTEGDLFRGCLMLKQEMSEIIGYTKSDNRTRLYLQPFLSFSKDEKIADAFIPKDKVPNDCIPCKIIIKKPSGQNNPLFKKLLIPNMRTGDFSKYKQFEEIVILPFSVFILESVDIDRMKGAYVITLLYDLTSCEGFQGFETIKI